MPIKINNIVSGSPRTRVDAFRKTIPNDVGYTVDELAELPQISTCRTVLRDIISKEQWAIHTWMESKRRSVALLVNPKTLAKYANQNK